MTKRRLVHDLLPLRLRRRGFGVGVEVKKAAVGASVGDDGIHVFAINLGTAIHAEECRLLHRPVMPVKLSDLVVMTKFGDESLL